MQLPQKKEAKKLRHLGSLRAHFHLPPIHAMPRPTLTRDTLTTIYIRPPLTSYNHLHGTLHTTLLQE